MSVPVRTMAAVDETVRLSARDRRAWDGFNTAITMLTEHLERRLHEAGLSHAHYLVLAALAAAPDHSLRLHELACEAGFSRSRLSHAVGRLAAAGWIRREACPSDKRGAFATLTPAGAEALRAATPARDAAVKQALFAALTEEQVDRLGEISDAVTGALSGVCDAAREADGCAGGGQLR